MCFGVVARDECCHMTFLHGRRAMDTSAYSGENDR
jgi:hypothetical protein